VRRISSIILSAIVVGGIIYLLVIDKDMRTVFLHWIEVTVFIAIVAGIIWVIWGSPRGE
jgi:hypothetical protein